jgi:hypothetical protein
MMRSASLDRQANVEQEQNVSATPDDTPGYAECAVMSLSDLVSPGRPRHVLLTHRPWMDAYCSLDAGELSFRLAASRSHTEGFDMWLWCLALYRAAMNKTYRLTDDRTDAESGGRNHNSELLRLNLLGLAGGNIKLAMDAALAGYYSGCLALERHMIETWRRSAYARLHPEDIWRWYPVELWPQGVEPAKNRRDQRACVMPTWPPSAVEIAAVINARGDEHDKRFLPKAERGFAFLNAHAHPTLEGASQTWDATDPGRSVFGPTFDEDRCGWCLHWGLFAGLILLFEVARFAYQGEEWVSELTDFANAAAAWGLRHQEQLATECTGKADRPDDDTPAH